MIKFVSISIDSNQEDTLYKELNIPSGKISNVNSINRLQNFRVYLLIFSN